MDKRTFLKTFTGQGKVSAAKRSTRSKKQYGASALGLATNTLNPYTGPWTIAEAAHLLRRTTFGPTPTQINEVVADGLGVAIGTIFEPQPMPDPPVYYAYENDPNVGIGETWVNTPPPAPAPGGLLGARRRSLRSWMIGLMNNAGTSIREKMTLFWHEHMPISDINRGQYNYHYINTIQTHALGNIRTLLEEITVAPAILQYLNGNDNSVVAPNENYSRELLELFTVGKGPAIGPGDYTNYTEDDVVALARALTGWRPFTNDLGQVGAFFTNNRHDQGEKQLSNRLGNVLITNEGDQEYKTVIDIILQQAESARFLCRQLHIWFIGPHITDEVEMNIIEPMAQILRNNNYEVQPALEALLSSEYFFMEENRGCMITHPLDFTLKTFNTFEIEMPDDPIAPYFIWSRLDAFSAGLQMGLLGVPSVAGWKAFYQAPQFGEFWINAVTLPQRETFNAAMIVGVTFNGNLVKMNLIDFIAQFENTLDPNELIASISEYIFAFSLAQNQKDYLKEVLIPGLPDFEWTVEYSDFLLDPDNPQLRTAIETKLQAMFLTMMKMPEYQLV